MKKGEASPDTSPFVMIIPDDARCFLAKSPGVAPGCTDLESI